jgi:hypothetical protein
MQDILVRNKTYQFLRSKYYAKNLFRCVIEFCHTCDVCLRYKIDRRKRVDKLH